MAHTHGWFHFVARFILWLVSFCGSFHFVTRFILWLVSFSEGCVRPQIPKTFLNVKFEKVFRLYFVFTAFFGLHIIKKIEK